MKVKIYYNYYIIQYMCNKYKYNIFSVTLKIIYFSRYSNDFTHSRFFKYFSTRFLILNNIQNNFKFLSYIQNDSMCLELITFFLLGTMIINVI